MRNVTRVVLLAALLLARAVAQVTCGLSPLPVQFFDNNGQPGSGFKISACISGNTCPGTPLATYTDSTCFTQQTNPIIADSSGRAFIWLQIGSTYKFVVRNSADVTLWTIDNISAIAPETAVPTNFWSLVGTTIQNNNAGGTGAVNVGSDLGVGGNINLTGQLKLRDTQASANYAILRANSIMTADVTWRWPAVDAAGVLTSDGSGNLTFGGGGGGSGTPGGVNTNVQFNNSGAFGGSSNFTWTNASQLLTITATSAAAAGISVNTGFIQADQGFLVNGTCTVYNCVNDPTGGMLARSYSASKYVNVGNNSGIPTVTTNDTFNPGALYYDTGTHALKLFNDSAAWVTVAAGGSTSPGGSTTNVQFNSAGSFGGSANLTYATQLLSSVAVDSSHASIAAVTGYIQSDQGFLATSGTCVTFNCVNAPTAGMYAKSFTAINYIGTGFSSSGVPPATTNDGFHYGYMYFDVTIGAEQVCTLATCTGSTGWASLGTGGGGSGTPGTPSNSVQFNRAGAFGGSSNLLYDDTTKLVTITTIGATAGLAVQNGYIQADKGFLASPATATLYNSINAPSGGMFAKSFTAQNYIATGSSSGVPPATLNDGFHFGYMYFDTALGVERLCPISTCTSSGWVALATGGIPSLNGLTGALSITGATNRITVTPSGTNINITTPQDLAGTSAVSFASVTTTSFHASSASGASLAWQGGGGTSQILGSGAASFTGVVSANGSTGALAVPSNTQFNAIQTVGGANLCSSSTCQGGSALSVNGTQVISSTRNVSGNAGVFTSGIVTGNPGTNSTIITGSAGNLYIRPVASASSSLSCSGVADGWLALTTDNFLVACRSGARFRATLVSF